MFVPLAIVARLRMLADPRRDAALRSALRWPRSGSRRCISA